MPTGQPREQRLAQVFAEFAALACGEGDEDVLQVVLAQRCVELLGVAAADVALSDEAGGLRPAVGVTADWTPVPAVRSGTVQETVMNARGQRIGVLTLTSGAAGHLDDERGQVGQALADAAANAVLVMRERRQSEQLTGQLQHALTSRVVIEQAVGILAERWQVDVKLAFQQLREYVRSHNLRLRDVAEAVVRRDVDPSPAHRKEQLSPPR